MADTKPIGVAYRDQRIENGELDADTLANSGVFAGENIDVRSNTIAATGNTDTYMIAAATGTLSQAFFSGTDALAASDTNYITFSVTNLGQAGAGSAAMLADRKSVV